jgi:hypothetical protein
VGSAIATEVRDVIETHARDQLAPWIDLMFGGVTYEPEGRPPVGVLDEYPFSNQNGGQVMHAGNTEGVAQSFRLEQDALITAVEFTVTRQGSPPGDMHACIYRATGTHGVDARPTGAALATSSPIAAASAAVSPSYGPKMFRLPTPIEVAAQVTHCVAFQYSGAGSVFTNWVSPGADATSPAHAGNRSLSVALASWSALLDMDLVFRLHGRGPAGTLREFWARLSILYGDTFEATMGEEYVGENLLTGVVVIDVFGTPGRGAGPLVEKADMVRDVFNRKTLGEIDFLPTSGPGRPINDREGWLMVSLRTPFEVHEVY